MKDEGHINFVRSKVKAKSVKKKRRRRALNCFEKIKQLIGSYCVQSCSAQLIVSGKGRKRHEHNHCHIGMVMGLEWVCDPDSLYVLTVDKVSKIFIIHEIQVW